MRLCSMMTLLVWTACAGRTDEDKGDTDKYGPGVVECSPVYDVSMAFVGSVVDADTNAPLANVTVALYDDNDKGAGAFGTATSGADGTFRVRAHGLTAWDGCLASSPSDYQLVLTLGDRTTDHDVNHAFAYAWSQEKTEVELSSPLTLP